MQVLLVFSSHFDKNWKFKNNHSLRKRSLMSETALFERKYIVYIIQEICGKLFKKENHQNQCNFLHKSRKCE